MSQPVQSSIARQPQPQLVTGNVAPQPQLQLVQGNVAPQLQIAHGNVAPQLQIAQGNVVPQPQVQMVQGNVAPQLPMPQGNVAPQPQLQIAQGYVAPQLQQETLIMPTAGPRFMPATMAGVRPGFASQSAKVMGIAQVVFGIVAIIDHSVLLGLGYGFYGLAHGIWCGVVVSLL